MKSYNQYCGLAKALDVIGDRWTLLIIRELLIGGGARYSDLQAGLPGIATNLLADRLSSLEEEGLIYREPPTPPLATPQFKLTPRGEALRGSITALGAWGAPSLATLKKSEEFRSYWLTLPLEELLTDGEPARRAEVIELRTGDRPIFVQVGDKSVRVLREASGKVDAVLEGSPDLILRTLTGRISLAAARSAGVRFEGAPRVLARFKARGKTAIKARG